MELWSGFIERFIDRPATWVKWYATAFAVFGIVLNLMLVLIPSLNITSPHIAHLTSGQITFGLADLFYVVVSVGAFFILGWSFSRAMRSGYRQLALSPELSRTMPWYVRIRYQMFRFLSLCVLLPLTMLSTLFLLTRVVYAISPHFSSDQHLASTPTIVSSVFMAALASTEELWRWAMIGAVLYLAKLVFSYRWSFSIRFRQYAFLIAVLVSSFWFGMAHVGEFDPKYKVMALCVLGFNGILFALFAIISRRLWLAVAAHGIYDFLAMSHLAQYAVPAILVATIVLLVLCLHFLKSVLWDTNSIRSGLHAHP